MIAWSAKQLGVVVRGIVGSFLLAVMLIVSPALLHAKDDPLAKLFGGPFTLQATTGKSVSDRDFRGRFMLIYFGFTHCPDICPTGLATLSAALDDLGEEARKRVQPIFITVDPARDTPKVMKPYLESFHPDILGLTGTEDEIAAVAKAYRLHRRKYVWQPNDKDGSTKVDATTSGHAAKAPASSGDDYGVDHGSITYLMGPDGVFRTLFPHGTTAERMTEVIQTYLAKE